MEKINNLDKIKRVRFFDYSNYDSEKVTTAVVMVSGLIT